MYKILNKFIEDNFKNEKGNASVEYVLIISMIVSIIFVLSSISIAIKNKFDFATCSINCATIEAQYGDFLLQRGLSHTEGIFSQFVNSHGSDICPTNNEVTYINGKVQCAGHNNDNQSDGVDSPGEAVPFL